MSSETEKQLQAFVVKQKAMILHEKEESRRCVLVATWVGFLNGLKLTNAISKSDYTKYYDEVQNFAKEINTHEDIKKKCSNINITGYGYELQGRCQAKQ